MSPAAKSVNVLDRWRLSVLTDSEGRGIVLKRLYDVRNPERWVPSPELADHLGLPIDQVHRYLRQLKDLDLIDRRFLPSGRVGQAPTRQRFPISASLALEGYQLFSLSRVRR
jgi:RIO-like serine/threonine protein kinase